MADLPCSRCDSSDAVEAYQDGDFCFSCHTKMNSRRRTLKSNVEKQKNPKKIQLIQISEFWKNWLKARGVNEQTINYFNLQFDELSGSIAYPLKIEKEIVGYQLRDVNKKIKTIRYTKEEEPFLFECCANNAATVVVVEDPVSAMRIWQETKVNTVSILGTKLSSSNKVYLLSKYKKIITWMDGDLPGYKAGQKIANDLDGFCETRLIYSTSDPKDLKGWEIRLLLGKILGVIK